MKKIIALLLTVLLLACTLISCGSVSSEIKGKWYTDKGWCLDVRSDGTYNYEKEYGTGTWKVLDDGETVEFKDFYGDTTEFKLQEDENGQYISYSGRRFYKQ